jgi:solute carrier family 25 folate transporter 32
MYLIFPRSWLPGCITLTFTISYDARKAQMHRDDPTRASLGAVNHMMAATESGLITLVLTNPIYVIKTRLCLQFGAQEFSEEKRYR